MKQIQDRSPNMINSISEEAIDYVNQLFEIFEIHINAFNLFAKDIEKLELAKHEWVLCFQDAKMEKHQLLRGIDKIRRVKMKYMISPSDFIELCMPTFEDIGAPSLESAFKEACEHSNPATWSSTWSHVIVKEAYKRTGNSQFLNGKRDKTLQIFSAHYLNALTDYLAGRITEQITYKKPFSSSDIDKPHMFGKYEMIRPGVMKIYENVKTSEECFARSETLLGKGTLKLQTFIKKLEHDYIHKGWVDKGWVDKGTINNN
jgi:hypothetical protein